MSTPLRFQLPESRLPTAWFNVLPRLPDSLPPALHPVTQEPIGPPDLLPLFPIALVEQEVSESPWVDIPGEVLDVLRLWRPTPLVRAARLEAALKTPARIYFKDESVSPSGSHKANTSVPQAFYNRSDGTRRLTTETGAGQWGTALAFASRQFGLECQVFMVRTSFQSKPHRRTLMETWGATCVASPVDDPSSPGSLGLAITDAVSEALARSDTHYALGSVLNHVLLHQTVIGLEAREQLDLAGEVLPDVVIASCGGGSNLGGIALPFVEDPYVRIVAVEPSACPTLTAGTFGYDTGDASGLTPLLPMYSLGRDYMPPEIHAGGLRYHGDSPIISALALSGRIEARAYPQLEVFEAARLFAQVEGRIPAPESAHAIAHAIAEAIAAREAHDERVILFNYSGHGLLDLAAYDDFNRGQLTND